MNTQRKYFLFVSLVLSVGFLLYLVVILNFDLSEIQSIFSIIGSLSVGVALITYLEKKDKDVTAAAIDLISLFRKEVVPANEDFIRFVKNKIPNYKFQKIKLDIPSISSIRGTFPNEIENQETLRNDIEIFSKQTAILNILEEVSQKINHFNVLSHPALNSIRSPFIETVEIHAWVLLLQREVFTGSTTYEATLEIYKKWKDLVDRRPVEERLKKTYAELDTD